MVIKTPEEIVKISAACRKAKRILVETEKFIKPGITTIEVARKVDEIFKQMDVKSAFLNYNGYPANICMSVNEEVVHGIPSGNRMIRDGDIVSVDIGVIYQGCFGDCADTFPAGSVSDIHDRLIETAREAFKEGMEKAVCGLKTGDIGAAIQKYVELRGFSVVRDFAGHGTGTALHEEPEVPNFGVPGSGQRLREGMVIAIEPMINEGVCDVRILDDGWTVVTADKGFSAHCENCILIKKDGPEILTVVDASDL